MCGFTMPCMVLFTDSFSPKYFCMRVFSNNATHFFDGENLYVTRRYYEDYIRDMAYNFAHPEAQKNEPLRTISDEELSKCITLDEFRDELTEMIHKHYHPEV